MTHIFKTDNVDTDVYGLPEFIGINGDDIENVEAKATVKWEAIIQLAVWGISGILTVVNEVNIDIKYDHYDVEDGKEISATFKDGEDGWKIKADIAQKTDEDSGTVSDCLYPNEVCINFGTKTITIG